MDHIQSELGTDLQWGWADIAAVGEAAALLLGGVAAVAAAGHKVRHGLQEAEVDHMRHTWGEAVPHRARQCEQERRLVFEPRRA